MCEVATWRLVAWTLAFAELSCGADAKLNAALEEPETNSSSSPTSPSNPAQLPAQWQQMPAPPLSARVESLVAAVGNTIVVAGGWSSPCPRDSDCAPSNLPPYTDGAAYDLATSQWRHISDAPVGVRLTVAAVYDGDIYALSQCGSGPSCPAGRTMLRYRSDADEWDLLSGPDELGDYGLVAIEDGVLAYSRSDETTDRPDYRFLAAEDRWVALPNDPLPPVYDRFVVEYAGLFMLFGTPIALLGSA